LAERGQAAAELPAPAAELAATAPSAMTIVVPVAGMTCRTCEVRIQRYVGRLPGVEHVSASAVHGRVQIESSAPVPAAAIAAAIRSAGYEVGATPWLERNPDVWLTALFGVALLAAFVLVAKVTGLDQLATGTASLGTGGLAVALLLGLAAGVSTCMALVGGLVLALSASFEASRPKAAADGRGILMRMRPALVFMSGRIAGYAFFGALLGALGAGITLPPVVLGGLMIGVAVLMTLVGARLTGLSPKIAAWSPTLPLGLARSLGMTQGTTGAYSDGRAAALGAATFFMPCGFTQAVQVYALSTGSPLIAGATMAVFAIGTAPGLLGLAGLPAIVPAGLRPMLLRVVGVVVIGFAVINGTAGIRLAGLSLPSLGAPVAAGPVSTVVTAGVQELTTFQAADGYSPGNVTIYAGMPTKWTIQSSTVATCASSLVVPRLGIQALLHVGANTFEIPAQKAGTIDYSCSMGMYGGRITVVDRPVGLAGGGSQ
jgi:sulfite exporter TauE/SafE/copper chaperone CopZ